MDSEVSDGWTKLAECELKVSANIDGERADGLSYKIGDELADGLPYKIVGKIAAGMIWKELVMNKLMGSTANEEFERRIAASWCGSRVAGWRISVVKTSASLVDIASLASKVPLVSSDTKWNVMVPRIMMKMTMTHRKREINVMPVTAVLASMASLAPMVIASMASILRWLG